MDSEIKKLIEKIGVTPIKVIAERRGSLLVRVAKQEERLVLKLHIDDGSEVVHRKASLLAHEAQVLSRIPELTNQLYVAHGQIANKNWLLIREIEGDELNVTAKEIRTSGNDPAHIRDLLYANLLKLSTFFDRLYRGGYLHGDVQPAHIYLENNQIAVIDWGLARKVGEDLSLYKGGFVYFVAPEVAKQMINKDDDISYTPQAEVYGIGATMFLLFIGRLPIDFGVPKERLKTLPIEAKLKKVLENRVSSFEDVGRFVAPNIERFLRKCLATDLVERFQDPSELHLGLQEINP